ncbi:MAG: DNA double-strand break repair nuclease NurA [Candidatus Bathycorpusculaceae bacterium]
MQTLQLKPQPLSLKPNLEETIVAAVDTSTMKVSETSTGIVVAVRGANVWKQGGNYRYARLGPFIFHLTEENRREVYSTLEKAHFGLANDYNHQGTPNLLQMPTRIANLLERWLQTMLSKTMANGLILFDGSLTSGTPDNRTQRMKEILGAARKRGNVVLAFSKMTTLRVNGHLITDFLPKHEPPCLFETANLKPNPPTVLLGDVYVARLSRGKHAFRLDIDREVSQNMRVEAVERLLGNDLLLQGYPETLRLAHILCTFTANEVLAMQHFITRRYGLQIVTRLDIHRLLFGAYGKGESYS